MKLSTLKGGIQFDGEIPFDTENGEETLKVTYVSKSKKQLFAIGVEIDNLNDAQENVAPALAKVISDIELQDEAGNEIPYDESVLAVLCEDYVIASRLWNGYFANAGKVVRKN